MTTTQPTESLIPDVVLRFMLLEAAGQLLHEERVAWCLRKIIAGDVVGINKVMGGARATYSNLAVCGSIWSCPVCASRITDARRHDMSLGLSRWTGSMAMATYTLSHSRFMPLRDVLASVRSAYRFMKSGRYFKRLKEDFYWVGSVRTLEVTYGDNGWHVHIHELVFIDHAAFMGSQLDGLKSELYFQWEKALAREGKTASVEHGVDVRTAKSSIADYIAKFGHEPLDPRWDIAHELTKSPAKRSRAEGGFTPMQLLHKYVTGDRRAGELFREYALAFKGTNQLVWSRGMRDRLGLGTEKDDQTTAEEIPSEFEPFMELSRRDWIAVRGTNSRGIVLHFAAEHDAKETAAYIAEISVRFWEE